VSHLRLTTAGESHGPGQMCVLEGLPAGLALNLNDVEEDLRRRRQGHGRGGRMRIEADALELISGVRHGTTLGTPVAILIRNKDHSNWRPLMQPEKVEKSLDESQLDQPVTVPRPGHADFAGVAKFGHSDIRNVLERSSARETVMRVAAGALAKSFLAELGVTVRGCVTRVGSVQVTSGDPANPASVDWDQVDKSASGCQDSVADAEIARIVERAREAGNSLGGVFEVWGWGLCPGLGHMGSYRERLDGRLMGAVGSIPAVKGVEIGLGFASASRSGSEAHDPFTLRDEGKNRHMTRPTNHAGGIEGGMTNGMPLIVRAAMKPIPTLVNPLPSVEITTMQASPAHHERSDVEAVAAARVIGEAMVALELADAYRMKFGGDSMQEVLASVQSYEDGLEERGLWRRQYRS